MDYNSQSRESKSGMSNLLPSIWNNILEDEEKYSFILNIRNEIIERTLNICYEKYFEKQTISFTVHCAYLAWNKVFEVLSMKRDLGDDLEEELRTNDADIECTNPDNLCKQELKPFDKAAAAKNAVSEAESVSTFATTYSRKDSRNMIRTKIEVDKESVRYQDGGEEDNWLVYEMFDMDTSSEDETEKRRKKSRRSHKRKDKKSARADDKLQDSNLKNNVGSRTETCKNKRMTDYKQDRLKVIYKIVPLDEENRNCRKNS